MNSHITTAEYDWSLPRADARRLAVLAGRLLFAAIFVVSAPGLFTAKLIGYAAHQGVPMAGLLVPLAGLIALAGGLSIALGFHAKAGAWLLVLFLVPVTLTMHRFWAEKDPMLIQMQQVNFLKNLALLGGVLLIGQFGAGPMSVDARRGPSPAP
ncbi:MAG: DoxX family protein [Gemmatimonadetes bacterium]|nr:MAG: DoxX family protein [Gemmatimonadota bacterium]